MPSLTIIAGCNGAGKSTFALSFLPKGQISFDFDKLFLENYRKLPDSELREKFAKDSTIQTFEEAVKNTIELNEDFCYETNFDVYPIYWAQKFKENGYNLNLIFFCIENQEMARHRVKVRTAFKGHFVDDYTIDVKWKAGYRNLNKHYQFFDKLLLVDNSIENDVYTNILQMENGKIELLTSKVPTYLNKRTPDLFELIEQISKF